MKFRSCQTNPEQVRLLLFKECDWRGRKLLFDSSTIEKVPTNKNDKPNVRKAEEFPCIVEVAEGYTYLYKGPAADANILGEMIFGAVAVNCKRVSLKIHIMEEPKRLMCTKVFCVPTSRKISRADRKTEPNIGNSRSGSTPLNVPALREEGVSLSFSLDRGDSGFCGEISPYSSVGSTCDYFSMFDIWDGKNSQDDVYQFHSPPGRKLSISSNGSWQRRTFQNMATRFDLGHQSSNLLNVPTAASNVTSTDSQVFSGSSTSGTSDSLLSAASTPQRKNKLGLALLFTISEAAEMEVVRRCVEHSPQLQALVCRLRLATLTAGAGGDFVSTLYRAACDAAGWLSDLMYGPRLQPVWLSLVTAEPRAAHAVAESLIADLCSVLAVGDTKHTNFFISTLVTHVLTYHLGWVSTVSPYDTVEPHLRSQLPPWAKRPHNALWAQLGDLCGSIGFPPRATRTVISGTNTPYITKLLSVLTYFVRCGEVKRSDYHYQPCDIVETKVVDVDEKPNGLKRIATHLTKLGQFENTLEVPTVNTQNSDSSVSTLAASDVSIKRSSTLANLSQKLSTASELAEDSTENDTRCDKPMTSQLRRNPTVMLSLKSSSDSSLNSSVSEESEPEQKVVFVLGDDEKLVGLKNKSAGGRKVKRSSKGPSETPALAEKTDPCAKEKCERSSESPSKCCGQTLQHSKPIKHSGFKFEFDKYPQIVTNYMKSKNLEILDRHYIGKPGNLKLDGFQFDPTVVPPIQEERCEACYKCQLESMLQTPTNASEMEYMNDMPQQQYAREAVVPEAAVGAEPTPKTFVRRRKENTVVVNVEKPAGAEAGRGEAKERDRVRGVKRVVEFPVPRLQRSAEEVARAGFDASLLGGVTDHYVPDLILQGTMSKSDVWESELRRDLDLTSYLNKALDSPVQAIAIVGDTNKWEVRVLGRDCGSGGMSSLVGAMLDALPAMRRAKVPATQCLSFLEGKLRELCVLSKTLADVLMSSELCDIGSLARSLGVDVGDVPLLLAVAATHTPQLAARYGISYR